MLTRTVGSWPLRAKLIAAFAVLGLVALGEAAFAYRTMRLNAANSDWVEHTYQVITLANDNQKQLLTMRVAFGLYLSQGAAESVQAYSSAQAAYETDIQQLERLTADNPPQVQRWHKIQEDVDTWVGTIVQPALDGTPGAASTSLGSVTPQALFDDAQRTSTEAVAVEKSLLDERLRLTDQGNRQLEWVLLGGTVAEAVLAVLFGLVIASTFGRALAGLAHAAARLASGNLDERIRAAGGDEIGQTAKAFNAMAGQMETLVADLREQVSQRQQAEAELQSSNQQLTAWVGELEQRDQEAVLLAQLGELLQACDSPDEAHQVLGSMLARFIPEGSLSVALINESHNLLAVVAHSGPGSHGQELFRPDECWSLRLGRPHQTARGDADLFCPHAGEPPPGFSLCVPMTGQGRSLGIVQLTLDTFPGERTVRDRSRLVASLADQVGLALANLRLRETLRTQALRDPLTGLFNRRYLEESLDREVSRASRSRTPFSVLMLDIDKFKVLNDTYGHQTGDEVLRQVARVLQREIRAGDLACRYGGEEFTLLLPEASAENAAKRAEHIRAAVADLAIKADQTTVGNVTISIGVAGYPEHGDGSEEVMQAADAALYRAKGSGRNRVELARPIANGAVASQSIVSPTA